MRGRGVIGCGQKIAMSPLPRFLNGYFFSSRSVKMTIPDETIFIENNNEFD